VPGLSGGGGSASLPWHRTAVSWQGPRAAPRPSVPSLGAGGPLTSSAQPTAGLGPTSPPAAAKDLGLPVPTAVPGTPGVASPGPGVVLEPASGVLGPPHTGDPPEPSPVPTEQTRHPPAMPGQLPASVARGSVAVAQSRGAHASPGPPPIPPSLTSSSAAATSPPPQPSLGVSQGVEGLSPTVSPLARVSPWHRLPHGGSGGEPAKSPQILDGTLVWVGDAEPWAATTPLSWQPGSPDPSSAPAPPQQLSPSSPASSLGLGTTVSITATITAGTAGTATTAIATITTATTAAATAPSAAVLRGDVTGLVWGPPTHLPTAVPGPSQQPTSAPGPLAVPGSPDLVQQPSSPTGRLDADTARATASTAGRAPHVFIVEDQPPVLRASVLRIPCALVLDMVFTPALQDPSSRERRALLLSFNWTVTPLFTPVPGFLRLEVTGIRGGSVVLEYDAVLAAERVQALGLGALLDAVLGATRARPGLAVGAAPVLRHAVLERPWDPCAKLFTCRAGFACVPGAGRNATCTSLCHRGYCKNQGICTHARDHAPQCRCPVGSDFWFVGLRCDARVTQQGLLGMAAGVLLSIVLLGAIAAALAARRFKALLLEARADQTRSSYRRFCRLDDVSAQYWSRSWLPSASSLDNPAFSNSEELLHLQILDNGCCGCRDDLGITDSSKHCPAPPARQPSFHYDWDRSSSSMNDPMVDSGKASDISVSSWPMEPIQWTPFPLLHQLSRQRPHRARRPRSFCEGMELGSLERSWTA
ncbi:IMPG2 protein, partial [Crotophaga sulcirostris]|nr:IMPG2 protein [Crotophaga sulcirostris]